MLDEIYTEQFKAKERLILVKREEGLSQLKIRVTRKELKSKDVKSIIDAAKKLKKLMEDNQETLDNRGIKIEGFSFNNELKLSLSSGHYYNNYRKHPEIEAYEEETERINVELAQKKKEIRARIYGLAISYEEADKEISKILKEVKV